MKVWITKYWNTRGIYQLDVEYKTTGGSQYAYSKPKAGEIRQQFKMKRDAFNNKNDAIVHANIERDKKLRKLRNDLERLERMEFKEEQLKGFPPRKGVYA